MKNEYKTQKRLTLLGLASFASVPFTGPLGIIAGLGILGGKSLRMMNEGARKDYIEEKKQEKDKLREIKREYNLNNGSPDYFGRFIERYNIQSKINNFIDKAVKLYHGKDAIESQRYIEPRLSEDIKRNYEIIPSRADGGIILRPIGKKGLEGLFS